MDIPQGELQFTQFSFQRLGSRRLGIMFGQQDSDTIPMPEGGGPGTRYHMCMLYVHACMYARAYNYGKQMYIICALNEKLTTSSCVTINHLQRQQTNITFCRDSAVFCCMTWRVAHGFQLSPLQAIINLRGCCT